MDILSNSSFASSTDPCSKYVSAKSFLMPLSSGKDFNAFRQACITFSGFPSFFKISRRIILAFGVAILFYNFIIDLI